MNYQFPGKTIACRLGVHSYKVFYRKPWWTWPLQEKDPRWQIAGLHDWKCEHCGKAKW